MKNLNGINKSNQIIVEGAEGATYDGLEVVWDCAGTANYDEIHAELTAQYDKDFADKWTPVMPSAKFCLRKGVDSLSRKIYNVDCIKKGVWAISIRQVSTANTVGVEYNPQVRVHVEKVKCPTTGNMIEAEAPTFSDDNHDLVPVILAKFNEVRQVVPSENIRTRVKEFFKRECDSITKRRAGGVEYIHKTNCEKFGRYANIIGSLTDTDFTVSEVFHGPNSLAGLMKHVTRDVMSLVDKSEEDRDNGVGKRAMGNRATELGQAEKRLERWATTLGVAFEGLADALSSTRQECVMAMYAAGK